MMKDQKTNASGDKQQDTCAENHAEAAASICDFNSTGSWTGVHVKWVDFVVPALVDNGEQFCAISETFFREFVQLAGVPSFDTVNKAVLQKVDS